MSNAVKDPLAIESERSRDSLRSEAILNVLITDIWVKCGPFLPLTAIFLVAIIDVSSGRFLCMLAGE